MNIFRRFARLICKPDAHLEPVGEPVRPRVTPDPYDAAELQRRRNALSYLPSNGFLVDVPEDTQ